MAISRVGNTGNYPLSSVNHGEKKSGEIQGKTKFSEAIDQASQASPAAKISGSAPTTASAKLDKTARHRIFEKIVSQLEDKNHPYFGVGTEVRKDMQSKLLELLDNSHYFKS